MEPRSIPHAELVSNLGWVQRLALSLARNADAADDLTQEVARVWLERRPELEDRTRIRCWLGAVARRLAIDRARSESARRGRERSVARSEATNDSREVVERGAWQQRVTEAVMELQEPYRSTILYCYLDQLPTRVVAERMDVREATVRKRLERGLALLRLRLGGKPDDHFGEGLAGILVMTTKTKLIAVVLAVGIALLLAVRVRFQSADVERASLAPPALVQTPDATEESPEAEVPAPEPNARATASDATRAVPATASATTGSLLVHVSWPDDKQPAAGVLVGLYRSDADRLFDEPRRLTDEHGTVTFADLVPGKVHAEVRRGGETFAEGVVLRAGEQSECTVDVELGMNCKGIVVDGQENPIADAEVLVADWGGNEADVLARTGADGRFAMRSIATHCHIGARVAGRAASPMRQFTAGAGANVELKLVLADAAPRLSGVVKDPQGNPVAGAVVQAGSSAQGHQTLPDGTQTMLPRPARARTDVQGRFEFASLPAGSIPLAVRARGLAPWKQTLELKVDQPVAITVELEPGVTVLGTVSDSGGTKIAKATVSLGAWDDLGHQSVPSDADGGFRIEGASSGELKLRAEADQQGKVSTTLTALAGQTVRWDPVLSDGLTLRGIVVDADGKPIERAMIEGHLLEAKNGVTWSAFENTDKAGRFTLKSCLEGEPIRIAVRRTGVFPELVLQHVIPSDAELVVQLPKEAWVYIQGKILGPKGEALPSVRVSPLMVRGTGSSPAETADAKTGEFRYGPYPPGEYGLGFGADGYPRIDLPRRVLAPDEVWDVGTLQFQEGGTLLVNVVSTSSPGAIWYSILGPNGVREEDGVRLEKGMGRSGLLAPGNHVLQIVGSGVAACVQPFEVRSGAETSLDVHLQPGIEATIECLGPENESGIVELVVKDRAGVQMMSNSRWLRDGKSSHPVCLVAGEYVVEASAGALRASTSLTLEAGSTAKMVTLRLAP